MVNLTTFEEDILNSLKDKEIIYLTNLDQDEINVIHGILRKLSIKNFISFEITSEKDFTLTDEGKEVINNGSPEYILIQKLKSLEVVDKSLEKYKGLCFKNKWIEISKEDKAIKIVDNVEIKDKVRESLIKVAKDGNCEDINGLLRRHYCKEIITKQYIVRRGEEYGKDDLHEIAVLSTNDILNSDFNSVKFKSLNFNTRGLLQNYGSLHPLLKIRDEIRQIFLELGFAEMATNQYVESSFWNFDALFQPQNHPSRNEQDTFFIQNPYKFSLSNIKKEYFEKIKNVHESSYRSPWDINIAQKAILRTHTTSVSTRYLYALSNIFTSERCIENLHTLKNGEIFEPIKLFSIDKVFRNETVDATHLAEFHQVEGLVAGYNLGLGDLMGYLNLFFTKLGLSKVKFKPASNPYTEPSMEVFGYHEGLSKWIEIGNSGIFRPEMLEPMGIPKGITVIAWGLSVERPAMMKYQCNNIRELVGPKVDLGFIKNSKFVLFK